MNKSEAKQVANLVRGDSDSLQGEQRLHLLRLFDGKFTVPELSEILGVSQRQVYKDKSELTKGYKEKYRDLDVPSELMKLYTIIMSGYKDLEEIQNPESRILAKRRVVDAARTILEEILELKIHDYLDSVDRLQLEKPHEKVAYN